ncbi:7TM diverse intracellular signaling domain-containing protein [Undibacterium sp.]|uniref:hybrid sensor histidine kinase/response regulator n=1 Tax=Undibacterium sp. TaxID=1914977 RepID=UPI0037506BB8
MPSYFTKHLATLGMPILWLLGIALLVFGSSNILAADRSLDVNTVDSSISLTEYFTALEDPNLTVTIDEVMKSNLNSQFRDSATFVSGFNFGYTKSAVWLRLHLTNSGSSEAHKMLEFSHWGLENIDYYRIADGKLESISTGSLRDFASRPYRNRYFVFPIKIAAQTEQILYFRIRSTPLNIPAKLWDTQAYHQYERNDYLSQSLFFGLALGMILYNLLLFIGVRDTTYLYYLLFVIMTTLTLADHNGLLKEFLWQNSPRWSAISVNIGYSLSLASLMMFMRAMLKTKQLAPRVDLFLQTVIAAHLLSPIGFVFAFQVIAEPIATFYGVTALIVFFTCLYFSFLRQRSAYFFLAAFSISIVGVFMFALRAFAMVPNNAFTAQGIQLGSAVEMVVLAFALADRFNQMRREKQRAQAEAIEAQRQLVDSLQLSEKVLEARIEERTAELVIARDSAEKSNRAKSVFLAKVSHELRTPIHAVLGYIELAMRDKLMPNVARKLDIARTSGQQLANQINDLLEHAKSENDILKIEPVSTPLHTVANNVSHMVDLLASDKGNRFTVELDPHLPPWVLVDAKRLAQVLMVLLNNAMRYTKNGDIILRLSLDDSDSSKGLESPSASVCFAVEDTGRGIAKETLNDIFSDFSRGASTDSDGLGLGLPIARHILTLMHSELKVESSLGQGSKFFFHLCLPLAEEMLQQDSSVSTTFTAYAGEVCQILVVDDFLVNRRYLEELLGDLGFDVRSFAASDDALLYLENLDADTRQSIKLCIVDQQLNGDDSGWNFILGLRYKNPLPEHLRDCPVLMLSATEPLVPDNLRSRRHIDQHLLKPADQQLLLHTIGEMAGISWISPTEELVIPSETEGSMQMQDETVWQRLYALARQGAVIELDEWVELNREIDLPVALQHHLHKLDFAEIATFAQSQIARST